MTRPGSGGVVALREQALRDRVRDLILILADSKRLLGYRYAEWMLGAPELETGIALSSMAQDEWGHARLLYSLLKEFEADVDALEHGREAAAYRNIEVLDAPAATWPDAVALMALVDVALSVQFEALRTSAHEPLRQRVEKMLEEERFHEAHGAAWSRRLAGGSDASAAALRAAAERVLEPVLRWYGPEDGRSRELLDAGVTTESAAASRARFLDRVRPLLAQLDLPAAYDDGSLVFTEFDEARRRSAGGGGPDEPTIRRIRGDHNRAFLMD